MSFDIEKMKADGVDPKIIDFIQLSEDELYNKIARRLENDSIFRDFMNGPEDFNSYAVAAGLITEAERKWLADENNPYVDIDTVTLTRDDGNPVIYYYTESGGEQKEFEDTLVIPKGTTLYFYNESGMQTTINNEFIDSGSYVPYTFTEDATISQEAVE